MIQNNLKISVEEFTTPDPNCASVDSSLEEVSQLMIQGGYRHIIVAKDNKALGIISDRDIHKALELSGNNKSLLAKDIMSDNVYRAKSTTNIDEVVFNMSDKKIGSAVIENENGHIYGIFTRADALNALVEIIRGEVDYNDLPKVANG